MTTIVIETVKCGCCGKKSKQRGLGSTNQFGSADLDLRPPPMARDTMEFWLQTCPGCGLVAEDLAAETPAVADLVRSDAYRRGGLDRAAPDLALTFLRQATIEASRGAMRAAFGNLLSAAWVADDAGDADLARTLRIRAAGSLDAVPDLDDEDRLRLADVLRRAGDFVGAERILSDLAGRTLPDPLPRLVAFARDRTAAQDDGRFTVADALRR